MAIHFHPGGLVVGVGFVETQKDIAKGLITTCKDTLWLARKLAPFDFVIASGCKVINYVAGTDFFSPETTATHYERRTVELQIEAKATLSPSLCKFAQATGIFAHVCIPRRIGDALDQAPEKAHAAYTYSLGVFVRYLESQINRQTNVGEWVSRTEMAKELGMLYCCLRNQASHTLFSPEALTSLLSVERILLGAAKKLSAKKEGKPFSLGVILHSLSESLRNL